MPLGTNTIKAQLAAFRRKQKFSEAEWRKRGLIPSSDAISAHLDSEFNRVADQLATLISNTYSRIEVDALLLQALKRLNRDAHDTEEAEFVCDRFATLASIFSLKLDPHLNTWLYGDELGETASKLAKDSDVVKNLSQLCTECGTALETAITGFREDNESEAWFSIGCLACGALNFLVLPPKLGSFRMIGYKSVTQYWRHQFNRQTAEAAFALARTKRKQKSISTKRQKAT